MCHRFLVCFGVLGVFLLGCRETPKATSLQSTQVLNRSAEQPKDPAPPKQPISGTTPHATVRDSSPTTRQKPRAKYRAKPKQPWEQTHIIRSGETLESIMERLQVKPHRLQIDIRDELADFLDLRKIRPGHRIIVRFHRNGRLDWLRYFKNPLNEWKIEVCWKNEPCYEEYDSPQDRKKATHWIVETQKVSTRERIVQHPVQIKITPDTPNFTAALLAQKQQGSLAPQLARLLGKQADLNRLYGGETFHLLVERLRYQGKYYGYRNILFARFQRKQQTPVMWMYHSSRSSKEIGHYYRPDGSRQGKQQLFGIPIRPFQPGSRRFGMRFHPILRRYRMHWGVDFSAPCGRRLYAIQGGQVITQGWRGGAGRMISIRHDNGWVSRYMHLSRYAVRKGSRIRRGQLIGYVGTTGLSTGCHLHFELMRWGRHLDPLKVLRLQEQHTIPCHDMQTFWRFQIQACHQTGLRLQQCQLQLPQRCFRKYRHRFWRLARETYGVHLGFAIPRRPGPWPTRFDRQRISHRTTSSPRRRQYKRSSRHRKRYRRYRKKKRRQYRKKKRRQYRKKKRRQYRKKKRRQYRKKRRIHQRGHVDV